MEDSTAEIQAFRLSPQQERLWRGEAAHAAAAVRCVVDVTGADEGAVRAALERVVARHEILRTTFRRRPGMKLPGQVIHPTLATAPRGGPTSLDVEEGPVVAASFVDGSGGRRLLELTAAAAVADARSLALVAAEIEADLAGDGAATEALQYADYAEWRAEAVAPDAPWQLEQLPPSPDLPFVRADDAAPSAPLDRRPVRLDADAIARAASAIGVSPDVFVEACWHACVARLSGSTDVLVGAVLDGRTHDELANAIGPYEQVVPLTTSIDEDTTLAEVADRLRRARARLEQQQDQADGAALAAAAAACRIGFSTIEPPERVEALVGGSAPFLVHLCLRGAATELQVVAPAVDDAAARLIVGSFETLAAAAADAPSSVVLDLPLLPPDRAAEAAVLAGPEPRAAASTAVELFERSAAEAPDAVALVAPDAHLTYRELNARANRLAHRLRGLGVGRDSVVGVCTERSSSSIVAILAVLKAGGAYVPLNFEHPAARLEHQLRETDARVLLTETAVADRVCPFDGVVIEVDGNDESEDVPTADPERVNESGDLVYVMYTSGSTGTPKGVGVTHGNLVNYTAGVLERLGLESAAGVGFAAVSALSTDLGNTSVFAALLGGGTLHLVSPGAALDGALFAEYVRTHEVDVLKITPSHLRALLGAAEASAVLPRRWLVLGGEALSWQLVDEVLSTAPACRILNHYGPTETTVGACAYPVGSRSEGATVPIGAPMAGARTYVVDRRLRPVPIGVPGELCIAGAGVARGYHGQPEQTDLRFVPDPIAGDGGRLYRTGDRVRALPTGAIEFLGRVDDQVKIRGYRVEPGEVESALSRHPDVRECAVVARPGVDGALELVAYVVGAPDTAPDDLAGFLRESLPAYMVPATYVRLDSLPLTPSGKIDRRRLPEPDQAVWGGADYVGPRTPLEEELTRIWQDLLGVERIGVHDDFFALGGHSLLATQAVIRIRKAVGDVPLHALFNAPTVAALAETIDAATTDAAV